MAFGIDGFNITVTPQFQRELQKINALPGEYQALARNATQQATAKHASKQFDKYMWGRQMAEKERTAEFGLKQAKDSLNLSRESFETQNQYRMDLLDLEREQFEAEQPGIMDSLLGLGVAGFGIHTRRKEAERQREYNYQRDLGGVYIPAQ